jgi:hypothetical protein
MTQPGSLLAALVTLGAAPAPPAVAQPPAIRPLGATVAASAESFGDLVAVRHLEGGVLVNDVRGRRVVLLDERLGSPTVIADSTPATATAYAGRMAVLLPYRGDSSLFVDAATMSMLLIDERGRLTSRVMSIPRSQDAGFISGLAGGAAFDHEWRLVYRAQPMPRMRPPQRSANGTMIFQPPELPDSLPVLRVDLATRAVDTVGFVKVPRPRMDVQQSEGRMTMRAVMNPLPIVDEFAVLSDGSVAFVRGRDYHVDFVRPDGSRSSAPKVPFEWQRLSDEDKVAFLDSVRVARERMANAPGVAIPGAGAGGQAIIGGAALGGAAGAQTIVIGGPGGPGGAAPGGGGAGGPGAAAGGAATVAFVTADELPDYKPAFFSGFVRADADGRLWVRTIPTKPIAGGIVYDVINGNGELIDRVQAPADRTIVGFGAGDVVYLRVAATGKLERATFR